MRWFDSTRRELPWRNTKDPYAILVSELMLQQTQVQTVLPYYQRFMERFPSIESLAMTSQEEVLRYWSGLGYYRRGRNLYRAAQIVVEKYHGAVPQDKASLLALPGIGSYTAGAVLSIAFGQSEPVVDGNVERVLSRLFALGIDLATSQGRKAVWKVAEEQLPHHRPGCHNQALMELGATLCLPTRPACSECPLAISCQAFHQGKTGELPVKTRRTKKEHFFEAVLLVEFNGGWLLTSLNNEGLYGGMWQFPWVWKTTPMLTQALNSWAAWHPAFTPLLSTIGTTPDDARFVATTRHTVTFRTIQTFFFLIRLSSFPSLPEDQFRWGVTDRLNQEALPLYQKKALKWLPSLPSGSTG